MLTAETKRHIDAARQVLVGVVPNPTSQIDQITNALIYKFMDDMDRSAVKQGDMPSFFVGDLERYAWSKLMDPRIGNQERLNLYIEGFEKIAQSKTIPELFRTILRGAFLPYRSPEVLGLFLKEIDYFDYSHSEELGNAYEYLLSIMSSQGDAGQFRTPRHIIDFMVDIVDPTKADRILDPACGTGGFLIKSYEHILAKQEEGRPLTPDDRRRLLDNFEGYDIDPGMVRITQVNMYLHQFKDPKIINYDTLSREDRWQDKFDVILANPPFMSPKGGVKTHSRFSIPSTRSEVLFVDYIMAHLYPHGRAAIIVPEGIIFQSGNHYKQLRKNLVEDGLYAVVSLPSGVFQPYSGVKTSILLFDNNLAKKTDEILFVKIESDGFDLGAQRRPTTKNDLPHALEFIKTFQRSVIASEAKQSLSPVIASDSVFARSSTTKQSLVPLLVPKSRIAENGDYNLSGDRYRVTTDYSHTKWPMIKLGEISEINPKKSEIAEIDKTTTVSFVPMEDIGIKEMYIKPKREKSIEEVYKGYTYFKENDVLVAKVTPCFENGKSGIAKNLKNGIGFGSSELHVIRASENVLPEYIYPFITTDIFINQGILQMTGTGGLQRVPASYIQNLSIPLPPLEIQQQIVAELDGYQNIIAGAKQIVANWKPTIDIDPTWDKVKLGNADVLQIIDGDRGLNYPKKEEFKAEGYCLFLNTSNVRKGSFDFTKCDFIDKNRDEKLRKGKLTRDDVVLTTRGTVGNSAYFSADVEYDNIRVNSGMVIFRCNKTKLYPNFLLLFINSKEFETQVDSFISGSAQPQLPISIISEIEIPLPPHEIQQQIVERIESERVLVESAKKLIVIYDEKIKSTLAKLWKEG